MSRGINPKLIIGIKVGGGHQLIGTIGAHRFCQYLPIKLMCSEYLDFLPGCRACSRTGLQGEGASTFRGPNRRICVMFSSMFPYHKLPSLEDQRGDVVCGHQQA